MSAEHCADPPYPFLLIEATPEVYALLLRTGARASGLVRVTDSARTLEQDATISHSPHLPQKYIASTPAKITWIAGVGYTLQRLFELFTRTPC